MLQTHRAWLKKTHSHRKRQVHNILYAWLQFLGIELIKTWVTICSRVGMSPVAWFPCIDKVWTLPAWKQLILVPYSVLRFNLGSGVARSWCGTLLSCPEDCIPLFTSYAVDNIEVPSLSTPRLWIPSGWFTSTAGTGVWSLWYFCHSTR